MEFRRFGSILSGSYHGCCAVCIIQNFSVDPDRPASMQMVHGDSGAPIAGRFVGKTYREMFEILIRTGTFNTNDMPNHIFLATITRSQLSYEGNGKKWLKILKEHGFEFIRATNNSVGSGPTLNTGERGDTAGVYLFGLFRNIGNRAVLNPFQPPKEWEDLPAVMPGQEPYLNKKELAAVIAEEIKLADDQAIVHRKIWDAGKTVFYTRQELEKAGVPITLSGAVGKRPETIQPGDKKQAVLEPIAEIEVEEDEYEEEYEVYDNDGDF